MPTQLCFVSVVPGMKTVLLVEDDPALLIAHAMILRSRGYAVLEAATVDEAMDTCRAHSGSIQLLLADFQRNVNQSVQLSQQVQALSPSVRLLRLSSMTDGPL